MHDGALGGRISTFPILVQRQIVWPRVLVAPFKLNFDRNPTHGRGISGVIACSRAGLRLATLASFATLRSRPQIPTGLLPAPLILCAWWVSSPILQQELNEAKNWSAVMPIIDSGRSKSCPFGNRQDFSHCNANVKSLLDKVLRRESGSVKAKLGRWSCQSGADVVRMWVSVKVWPDERAAFQEAAS